MNSSFCKCFLLAPAPLPSRPSLFFFLDFVPLPPLALQSFACDHQHPAHRSTLERPAPLHRGGAPSLRQLQRSRRPRPGLPSPRFARIAGSPWPPCRRSPRHLPHPHPSRSRRRSRLPGSRESSTENFRPFSRRHPHGGSFQTPPKRFASLRRPTSAPLW